MKSKVEIVDTNAPSKNAMKQVDKVIKLIADIGCNKLTIAECDHFLQEIRSYCEANMLKPEVREIRKAQIQTIRWPGQLA